MASFRKYKGAHLKPKGRGARQQTGFPGPRSGRGQMGTQGRPGRRPGGLGGNQPYVDIRDCMKFCSEERDPEDYGGCMTGCAQFVVF